MAMTSETKQRYLSEATFILQVQVERRELSPKSPGESTLRGRIIRLFKGDALSPGEMVTINVETYCIDLPPPPGDCYTFVEDLRGAIYIEVYLNPGDRGQYRAIATEVIPSPTDTPYYLAVNTEGTNEDHRRSPQPAKGFWHKLTRWLAK